MGINLLQPCHAFKDSAGRKMSHAAALHVLRHSGGITTESAVICVLCFFVDKNIAVNAHGILKE